ncbi:MAG: hypothetical protein HOY71_00365 [Nonomuraea sp.]|nr:hypothetical protein [Nonomuraea sp.]
MKHLWYGLGLLAAVAALVAVQVLPKLEQYELISDTRYPPAENGRFAGSTWRLLELRPAQGEGLPDGVKGVTAVIGVTPGDEAASKALGPGCEASVRDAADRVWGPSNDVRGEAGLTTLCTRIDEKTYKPILNRPGAEVKWQASFAVPAGAVSSLRVEVRLQKTDGFVRLSPTAAPSGGQLPAG